MGLKYSSDDSSTLMGALTANLSTATVTLESTETACSQLCRALGGGDLSGQGYAAVNSLFAEIIRPCIVDAKNEVKSVQEDLDSYTQADGLVSQYGVLNEDQLNTQLESVKVQRDATEALIETNREIAASSAVMPGLGPSLEAANARLELVLTQLENEAQELQDKLRLLREFASQTAELFADRLLDFAAATGDTVSLMNQLGVPNRLGESGLIVGAVATRSSILDFLAGNKITRSDDGRLRYGGKFLYRPKSGYNSRFGYGPHGANLYSAGNRLNQASNIRIDHYQQPLRAGASGALKAPIDDFSGWKGASTLTKFGRGLGAAGTVLTVGNNFNTYFHDGAQGNDVRDFAIDTTVDVGSAAAAAGIGAAVGSFCVPPLGTVVGAGVGLLVNWFATEVKFNGQSAVDWAKTGAKNLADWAGWKFW